MLRLRNTGNFQASDLVNVDHTPLPFVLDDGKNYDKKGVKEVWAQSGQSGLDKRQPTVHWEKWENPFKKPIGQNSDVKILIADVHPAQQTNSVKELLKKLKIP